MSTLELNYSFIFDLASNNFNGDQHNNLKGFNKYFK